MPAISHVSLMLKNEQKRAEISSNNIESAQDPSYVCKHVDVIAKDGLGGSTLSKIYTTKDPILQSQTRKENSIYSKQQITDQFYQKLNLIFGSKGTQTSFVHSLGRFTSSMREITTNADLTKKIQAVNDGISYANQINNIAHTINELRGNADQMLDQAVSRVNTIISLITNLNQQISSLPEPGGNPTSNSYVDVTDFENKRDELVHELAGLVDISVFKTPENKLNISLAGSGRTLVQGNYKYQLDYTPHTLVEPGQTLSPVMYLGADITAELKVGQIAGLVDMRDTVLVSVQKEFDELTRTVRDTVNALHNQGSSFRGASTLTGTTSVPGLEDQLDLTTQISGRGVVRIGVIDNLGTMKDYKDIALTDGMTINTLINSITSEDYKVSGGGVAAPGGGFTFTRLDSGAIQIQSTDSNNTIVIGAVGSEQPMLSLGDTYDEAEGFGFSHFLGLNNLFVTGSDLASLEAQKGIANTLQVRPDIANNPSYLSVGSLSQDTPISSLPGGALGNRKTDIADKIQAQLSTGKLSFLAAGKMPPQSIDAQSYANQMMSMLQGDINQSSIDLKLHESLHTQLASLSAKKSSVNVSEELIKIYDISQSKNIASKVLSLLLEMDKFFINNI